MEKDFFTKNYPQITALYNNYINSEEYTNHPILKVVEPDTSRAIEKAFEQLSQGDEIKASDKLTSCAITYEQAGFTLGFSLAMNILKECGQNTKYIAERTTDNEFFSTRD